ncbi:hypothetical protein D3C80_1137520 [compost metagenome]
MKLRLPGLSALLECQYSRCSLPGELDCGQLLTIMSKSRERRRLMYCETSTRRITRSIPRSARLRLNGSRMRSNSVCARRNSMDTGLPWASTILSSTMRQPASCSSL